MLTLRQSFITILGIFAVSNLFAAPALNRSPAEVRAAADKVIAEWGKDADLGVVIESLDTGAILYEHNADRYFQPASTQKILTAAAALFYLGPDYRFISMITAKKKIIKNGTLYSDVYFKFDGDPTFTRQDLDRMVADLAQLGISNIQGNVYIDDSVFDQKRYGPGWMWDELDTCYAAPTHGIIINKNCFNLSVEPGKKDQSARVATYGSDQLTTAISNVTTKSHAKCDINIDATDNNEYYVSGCLAPNSGTQSFELAVKNIRLYAQDYIQLMLTQHHINYTGKIIFAEEGKTGAILVSHQSQPLSVLVNSMLKHSDNQIADSLFKKVAYYYYDGASATWGNGSRALSGILSSKANVKFAQAKIADGSGLSRYNLITPKQMLKVLAAVYRDDAINKPFYTALPVSGVDGTLRGRMTDLPARGRVHAKTGTMTGISNLAGYVQTVDNKNFAFVIMFNTFPDSTRKYTQLEDKICKFLVKL